MVRNFVGSMAIPIAIALCLWASVPFCMAAQQDRSSAKQDSGVFIRWLGKDTIAIQRFVIKSDSVFTKILFIPRGLTISEGSGTLFPDGSIKSMHSKVFTVSSKGTLQLTQESHLTSSPDSTWISVTRDRQTSQRSYFGRCFVTNDADITSFHVFPFWGLYAPQKVNDSVTGYQFSSGKNRDYTIKRSGAQSLRVGGSLMGYLTLVLDGKNRLDSMNGVGSTQNWIAKIHRTMNFDSIVSVQILRQQRSGVEPPLSIRDTVKFTKGNLSLSINYWRPSARGRKIFGEVVPYNRFWRVGANNATEIQTTEALYFGDKRLESGKYSVFILPTLEGWTMMFNKKTGIWGTDYDASHGILRVPMTVMTPQNYTEQLSVSVAPSVKGGTIYVDWERTRGVLPFEVKE